MRAVILYESMYGNTRHIAEAIGQGLARNDVTITTAPELTADQLKAADLVIVGAPTHIHGLPRPSSRRGAVEQVNEDLILEPAPTAGGIREWLATVPDGDGRSAAAFDTRLDMNALLSGRASKEIARDLRQHGFILIAEPESFLVDRETRLLPGELERARSWGASLAGRRTQSLV